VFITHYSLFSCGFHFWYDSITFLLKTDFSSIFSTRDFCSTFNSSVRDVYRNVFTA